MKYFLNYQNGQLTVNKHQFLGAREVSLKSLQEAARDNVDETLFASFEQNLEYHPDREMARFTGVCASNKYAFQICWMQESHNVKSREDALKVWGLDENLEPKL